MLRACPHHGFTELTQVDTFYNGLNDNDQDSLNAAAGGNLLSKTTREALNIIENKSKVRYSRNKPNASRMNTTSRENVSKTDERIDKLADQLSTLVEIVSKKVVTPAPVKAVEETCVTCGGAHSWSWLFLSSQFLRIHLRAVWGHLLDELSCLTPIIAPTIPPSPNYTPASPDYLPASDLESDPSKDPSSDHIPPLPVVSPFLSSTDDTTDNDTPDTPPSPTHGTPFTEITASTHKSPVIPRRRVMILAPGQPIPYSRPYRYHLNGPVHMMTVRKRVIPLPVQQLAVRHSVNHSSSDYFSLDDSVQDSSSDSSSEASSDFHSDASSSRHSLSDHSSPDLPSTSAGPSRKRHRSLMTFVPTLPLVSGALSLVRANLIPSPKRVRDSGYLADLEGCSEASFEPYIPREVGLGVDIEDESSEQSRSRGTDIEMDDDVERSDRVDVDPVEAVIEACFDFADIIRASGVDVRVEAVTVARDDVETGTRDPIIVSDDGDTPPVVPEVVPEPAQEGAAGCTYETLRDLVQRFHDHTEVIPVHRIQVIKGVQREQGHRIVRVESAVTALTKRVAELERDNRRLRGTMSVESQRVDRLQHGLSRMQRELRQIKWF
ncbi:hypothetical protein Tco_1408330 [Tanacetum coccineum]